MSCPASRYPAATVDDLDTSRTAARLLESHGDTAPIFAAMEADALLDAGDLDGAATWRRILDAIKRLQDKTAGGIVH